MTARHFSIFEQSHAIEIMLALPDCGTLSFMTLVKACGGSVSMVNTRLGQLKEAGLVKDEIVKSFPKRRLISLTDLGREVSVLLEILDNALEGARRERG